MFNKILLAAAAVVAVNADSKGLRALTSCPDNKEIGNCVASIFTGSKQCDFGMEFEECTQPFDTYVENFLTTSILPGSDIIESKLANLCSKNGTDKITQIERVLCKTQVGDYAAIVDFVVKTVKIFVFHDTSRRALVAETCPSFQNILSYIFDKGIIGGIEELLTKLEGCEEPLVKYLQSFVPSFLSKLINIQHLICDKNPIIDGVCEMHMNHFMALKDSLVDLWGDVLPATKTEIYNEIALLILKLIGMIPPEILQDIADLMTAINTIMPELKDIFPVLIELIEKAIPLIKAIIDSKVIPEIEKLIHDLFNHGNSTLLLEELTSASSRAVTLSATTEPSCPAHFMDIVRLAVKDLLLAPGKQSFMDKLKQFGEDSLMNLEKCNMSVQAFLNPFLGELKQLVQKFPFNLILQRYASKTYELLVSAQDKFNAFCKSSNITASGLCYENVETTTKAAAALIEIVSEIIKILL